MFSGANSAGVTGDMDQQGFARTGCLPDMSADRMICNFPCHLDGVSVRLKNRELWQKFSTVGTEMIITKPGRRMFPYLDFKVEGLFPEDSYVIALELRRCSEYRYRFQGNEWVESGRAKPPERSTDNMFVLSPKKGKEWMQDSCCMYSVKITNSNERIRQKVEEEPPLVLTSMQKYVPVVHVIKTDSKYKLNNCPKASFVLPEGEFIAVTAYQNVAVKDLKVANNPFAKAFRPGATSNRKRKSNQTRDVTSNHLTSDGGSSTSPCSTSPCSLSPSTSAVEIKVVDDPIDRTPTSPPLYNVCLPLYQSTPYPEYRGQAIRMAAMMQQYIPLRPWEVPPITICNSNPYRLNFPYSMPLYLNSIGYPLPQSSFYPALPSAPTYPFDNELIDLSKRAHDEDKIEENPT